MPCHLIIINEGNFDYLDFAHVVHLLWNPFRLLFILSFSYPLLHVHAFDIIHYINFTIAHIHPLIYNFSFLLNCHLFAKDF